MLLTEDTISKGGVQNLSLIYHVVCKGFLSDDSSATRPTLTVGPGKVNMSLNTRECLVNVSRKMDRRLVSRKVIRPYQNHQVAVIKIVVEVMCGRSSGNSVDGCINGVVDSR